ncbi:hypothetical protein ACIBCN_01775 [Nocardia sp. NPDC051052]|uniref:hypothetical protein n=1 Tax=Nocardia sp. NPDC051052 TaxID=3364322 RepID=UPI0037AD92E3
MADLDRDEEVVDWLRTRNTIAFENMITLTGVLRTTFWDPTRFRTAVRGYADARRVNHAHRTVARTAGAAGRIGDFLPDVVAVNAAIDRRRWSGRVVVAAVSVLIGWGLGWPLQQVAVVGAATLFLGSIDAVAVALGIAALVIHWQSWASVGALLVVQHAAALVLKSPARLGLFLPTPYAAPVMTRRARLRHPHRWSTVSVAVESAFAQDPHVALRFIEASGALPQIDAAAVLAAKAVALVRVRQVTEALMLVEQARQAAAGSPRVVALIHLADGEVMFAAGRMEDALSAFESAARTALGRDGCAIRLHARRRRVALLVDLDEWARAYDELLLLRCDGLQRREGYDVNWTELILVRMMLRVDNIEGIRRTRWYALKPDNRNVALNWTSDDHIAAHLLMAVCALHYDDPEQADAEVAQALVRLADHPNSAFTVQAYYLWTLVGDPLEVPIDELLARIFAAIREGQRLRFRLPASVWRNEWAESMETVYGLGLEIAAHADDQVAVAEIIEIIRAQPIPTRRDESDHRGSASRLLLEAALRYRAASTMPSSADADAMVSGDGAILGADLIEPPPTLRIGGVSWGGPPEFPAIDLETCLGSFAAESVWYLGGAVVEGALWISLREPSGRWSFVRHDLSGIAGSAVAALLDVIPDVARVSGADGGAVLRAATASVLGRWQSRRPDNAEIRLLGPIAELLLPVRLRRALAKRRGRRMVVVTGFVGVLTAIPVAGLPLSGTVSSAGDALRVIDSADLIHPPPWAAVHANIRFGDPRAVPATGVVAPLRLAVVSPDPASPLAEATVPSGAQVPLVGSVDRQQVARELGRIGYGAPATALFVCHGVAGAPGQPATGGLRFADGVLEVRDLITFRGSVPRYAMPERVIASACESLGADFSWGNDIRAEDNAGRFDIRANPEWIGFPIGCLAAGARHVIATRYCLPADAETDDIDHLLAAELSTSAAPWTVVGDMQRGRLHAARSGEKVRPLIWLSYGYYGFGSGQLF